MTKRAWLFIMGVLAAGCLIAGAALLGGTASPLDWETLAALTLLATGAQLCKSLFKSKIHSDNATSSYSPILLFLFAGVVLLPPALYVFLVLIPHSIEWLKERYQKTNNLPVWYIQPFNVAVHIICGIIAHQAYAVSNSYVLIDPVPGKLTAGLLAALVYVGLNHLLVGLALVMARGATWRESGVFDLDNLLPDFIMMCLGFGVALLWQLNPWFSLTALSALALVQRSLMVTQLKQEARLDSKTGLWNARHFAELFRGEFKRAKRFDRPLAVVMADLDMLRNINNTYGHLAGDAVLEGIGNLIRATVREYDIPCRFGGEEFLIAMPEACLPEAAALAERIRKRVESTEFHAHTTPTPIRATISLGVACFPLDANTEVALIHAADIAVYQAKLMGRNRVVRSSDLPRALDLESAAAWERLNAPLALDFSSQLETLESLRRPQGEMEPIAVEGSKEIGREDYTRVSGPAEESCDASGPARVDAQSRDHAKPATDGPEDAGVTAGVPSRRARIGLNLFVATILGMGLLLALLAFAPNYPHDWMMIALFTGLALFGELFQVDAADENTMSVSVAVNFAAALVGGLPALICSSGAIALVHRLKQPRPWAVALYRTGFNWSVHILAGLAPLVMVQLVHTSLDTSNLGLLLIPAAFASVAYFAVESSLLAVAIGLSTANKPAVIWKENFRWLTGHYLMLCMMGALMSVAYRDMGVLGIAVFVVPAAMMRYALIQYVQRTRDGMQEMKRMNRQLIQANAEVIHASRSIRQMNEELFLTLSKIIDARDPYVSGHATKVTDYSIAVANELAFPPERVEWMRQAALLHDIGKIGIPERILHKPKQLTGDEYEFIKTHAKLGDEFLLTCRGLRRLATFVRHHHEWWDGTGYPDGLRGEQIPLEARVLSVCDAVEAMASDRPYSRSMTLAQIVAEVKRCSGTQFDPQVAAAFVRIAEREGTRLIVNSAREVTLRTENGAEAHPQFGAWLVTPT